MSMNTSTGPLCALRWFTIDPSWIEQSAAFSDPDPRMAAAYMRLLLAAWRGLPAATVPAAHRHLAQVTGLDVATVGEKFAVLTEGFVLLADGRLHHEQMEKLAMTMLDRYGKEIEEHALAAAMALQDPERFQMVAVEGARSGAKGKRTLPRGFGFSMHPELREWCAGHGYPTPGDQDWAMEGFLNFSQARNDTAKDWAAQFKVWATKELTYGRLPPSRQPGGQSALELGHPRRSAFSALASAASKGERARMNNAAVFGVDVTPSDPAAAAPSRPRYQRGG
jgi:hypothetical protein